MSKSNIISVFCFNTEIGVLGHDSESKNDTSSIILFVKILKELFNF